MLRGKTLIQDLKKINWRSTKRWFKYKFLQLVRAKNGSAIVARGFSIGLAIEMFTLPTFGLAFFLIFPLIYLMRGSLVGALIGFVFGKIIYIPMSFLNKWVGKTVLPKEFRRYLLHHMPSYLAEVLRFSLELIVGGIIVGTVLGLLTYFPVKFMIQFAQEKRKERRKRRKMEVHAG
jgi:uncharacterized protein